MHALIDPDKRQFHYLFVQALILERHLTGRPINPVEIILRDCRLHFSSPHRRVGEIELQQEPIIRRLCECGVYCTSTRRIFRMISLWYHRFKRFRQWRRSGELLVSFETRFEDGFRTPGIVCAFMSPCVMCGGIVPTSGGHHGGLIVQFWIFLFSH